jgi:nitroreductase
LYWFQVFKMNNQFSIISSIIHNRRSIKSAKMNGKKIPDEQVREILELGNWAPTHGRTEPWRFIVYPDEKVKWFCHQHAELYKSHTPAENFLQTTYDKLFHNGDLVSHIVIGVMHRGNNPKIPALEEICATAAAIENILLGATAAGVASFWSSGGMTHKQSMKDFLELKEEDVVMGIIYLGYSEENPRGSRATSINEKITWK